jgi:hypothetical protein
LKNLHFGYDISPIKQKYNADFDSENVTSGGISYHFVFVCLFEASKKKHMCIGVMKTRAVGLDTDTPCAACSG